jgi:uncharacterized membrane protein
VNQGHIAEWIELAATLVEVLAVAIMLVVILMGTARWLGHSAKQVREGYQRYRIVLGKALLLGLELLVAADIIRTVAIEPTLANLAVLGALVVIRTFLGWSLSMEVEGHWPWQGAKVDGFAKNQKLTTESTEDTEISH